MSGKSELTGIAWNHSRALPPLVATAQRYEELNPGVRIRWEKRSLHEFGHMPVDVLAERFDLIVIDHPWAGFCFARNLVHDLYPLFAPGQLEDLEQHSVGASFESYKYGGKLLAVPIDAATPSPSFRPDLFEKYGFALPETWNELVSLADTGRVVMPGFPADLFLNWCMIVEALGGKPFTNREEICESEAGKYGMNLLKRLAEKMTSEIYGWNPIAIAERMSRTDDIALCAFAYTYNNYSRPSFTPRPLRYGALPSLDGGVPLRSIIGGTGIAVTRQCKDVALALDYIHFTGSSPLQSGIYALAGGQPSRREAWSDPQLNTLCGDFFSHALRDQEQAIVRPRYDGYVPLQEEAGLPLQQYLKGESDLRTAWDEINARYRASLPDGDFPSM